MVYARRRPASPSRPSRRARLTIPLLIGTLLAATPLADAAPSPRAAAQLCPDKGHSAPSDWALTSTDPTNDHHAYAANGYLGQSLPPAGSGYSVSRRDTGWPLKTPRYDGAFVAGLYAHNKQTADDRHVIAALPTWSGLTVTVGRETFGPSTP